MAALKIALKRPGQIASLSERYLSGGDTQLLGKDGIIDGRRAERDIDRLE